MKKEKISFSDLVDSAPPRTIFAISILRAYKVKNCNVHILVVEASNGPWVLKALNHDAE